MRYRVLLTRAAERDIREAVRWWRDNRSPAQAERWYAKILPAIATLSERPERCPASPETDLLPTGLRQLHFGLSRKTTHRIVFTIEGSDVKILRVRHVARQDLGLHDLSLAVTSPYRPRSSATNAAFFTDLRAVVGEANVLVRPEQLRTYECDGLTNFRVVPTAVVLPTAAGQVREIVRLCARDGVPFVSRGSGTGLSGGALPVEGGIVISLARLNRILEVDIPNGRVVVEPGVINSDVTRKVAPYGYFYAPDPSSQTVCTIGGNVAENAGGAHCLKYGFTTTHVLGLEIVLSDGSVATLGGGAPDAPGYDLCGVFVGSEGTLGVATQVTLRVVRRPETVRTMVAAFQSTDATGEAVSRIIAAGILPAAAEMMDRLSIQAAEAAVHAGYPECDGLLLVELDGTEIEVELLTAQVRQICVECGAWETRLARSDAERLTMWKGRKAAFAAMGRISPNYIVQDGVIPRTALPQVLREIAAMSEAAGLRVANVFHAGDGNLHPLVLYDRRIAGQEHRAEQLAADILRLCVRTGGSLTGEHGIGVEKRDFMPEMFAEPDLATMRRVRVAFDPHGLSNPEKVLPRPRLCAERPGPYEPHPLETAGVAELF